MATAKAKTSTGTTAKTDEAPSITVLKKATTKSLEGKAALAYQLGTDDTSALHWRLTSNSGGGFFSDEWVAFQDIQKALEAWPKDKTITSIVLRPLFLGKSANNPSFLMATLVKEGILQAIPEKKRQYQIGDISAFLETVEGAKAGHSKPVKPRAKAKAKAGARMTKPRKPAAKSK